MLAATGAEGLPLVVEISVAFSFLIAFIVIGIFCSAFANVSIPLTSGPSIVTAESGND